MFFNAVLTTLATSLALLDQAAAATLQTRATSGCGKSQDFAGKSKDFTINSSGGTRSYRVRLPSTYTANTARPLLLAYHGSGGSPAGFEGQTGFSDEKINPNMITVYPGGVSGNWQGPTYATPGVSDKVFTTDLVNYLKAKYCIGETHVYATGHSNGGGFVNTLACSPAHGGQFAAFAPVSAALYTDVTDNNDCTPARSPLPIFETHGTADGTIPYTSGNGRGGPLPAISEWLGRWAVRNQCTNPVSIDLGRGVTEHSWTCKGTAKLLKHYEIAGQGHGYPDGGNPSVFITPKIIEFLSAFRRP